MKVALLLSLTSLLALASAQPPPGIPGSFGKILAGSAGFPFDLKPVAGDGNGPPAGPPTAFIKIFMEQLNTACDGGPPDSCECLGGGDQTEIKPSRKGFTPLSVLFCKVGKCKCGDEEVDPRPAPIKALDFCDRAAGAVIESCECSNEEKGTLTIDVANGVFFKLKELFLECRPKKCTCSDGATKVITEFGCKNGGTVVCPDNKLACQDGTKLDKDAFKGAMNSLIGGEKTCVCPDNKYPVCETTKVGPQCPGGESPELDKLPLFLQGCSK